MANLKILAEASVPFLKGVIEDLGDVTYLPSSAFTPEIVREQDWLIVRSITKCTRDLLEGSRVRLITSATIGYDHIDRDYCDSAGIVWRNAPGCNAESVGQYFAGIISRLVIETGYDPRGRKLGIVGVGHVGSIIRRYAEAFGMICLLNDPPRADKEGEEGFVSLDTIAEEADIITFHTPLEYEGPYKTYHLCDASWLATLRRQPILINACRGAVCDNTALLEALERGLISRLVLDCWEHEPKISLPLLEQVWLGTPHIAGFSADGKSNGARRCVEEGMRFFDLHTPKVSTMYPSAPKDPVIDLSIYPDHRIFRALLHTYDPRLVDQDLRVGYHDFERLRRDYCYPREPHAYTIIGADPDELPILRQLGFKIK